MRGQADLILRSRRMLTALGIIDGALAIKDGRISAIVDGDQAVAGEEMIDLGNQAILPGLVDIHAHLRDPGFTDKEDFETGTRAAAAGGVTTVLDMPNVNPVTNTVENLKAHIANASRKAIVDFGHNAAGTIPENIKGLADAGATAFKIFMMADIGRDYPHVPGTAVHDHGMLWRIAEEVRETGRPLFVHPHDQSLYELFTPRSWAKWGRDFRSYARNWFEGDGVVLDAAIAVLLQIQRGTGVHLHVLHMATTESVSMIRAAKAAGRSVTCETDPYTLFLANKWENVERLGPFCLGMWVPEAHAEAVWQGLLDGTVDALGTDHAPHTKAEKEIGWTDMYAAMGGAPVIQHHLSLFLNAVNEGRLGLEDVARVCSTRPAQIAGLYPRKGVIAVGGDADLVVVDEDRTQVVSAAKSYYKCGWTPLEGVELRGVPTMTFLRGQRIALDGEVLGQPGIGRLQRAVTAEEASRIEAGPAGVR